MQIILKPLGFLCNAYIKASMSMNSIGTSNVIHITGIVGNWALNSRAQMRYLKELFRSNISATRLGQLSIFITQVLYFYFLLFCVVEFELIAPEHLEPMVFHKLKEPLVSIWHNEGTTNHFVIYHVKQAIKHPEVLSPADKTV